MVAQRLEGKAFDAAPYSADASGPATAATARTSGGLWREGLAGLVTALGTLPQNIPWGLFIFLPLGPAYVGRAAATALLAAAAATLVALLVSPNPLYLPGPRPTSSIITASMVAWLAGLPVLGGEGDARAGAIVLLTAGAAALAGIAQLVVAKLRLARIVNHIPTPVTVGFNLGVALTLLLTYLPVALGRPAGHRADLFHPALWDWREAAAAAAVVAVYLAWSKTGLRSIPALLGAMVAGGLVLALVGGRQQFSELEIGLAGFPLMPVTSDSFSLAASVLSSDAILLYVGYIASLTLVSSAEALLTLSTVDEICGTYTDPSRQIRTEGILKGAAAAVLGVLCSSGLSRFLVLFQAGGRGRASVFVTGAVILGFALLIVDPSKLLPPALIGGILLTVAHGLVDPWGLRALSALASFRRGPSGGFVPIGPRDGAIVLITAATAVLVNALAAVAVGVVVSVAMFTRDMSRPVIASIETGEAFRSRRMRPALHRERLFALAPSLRIAFFEGSVFFGTADSLRRALDSLLAQAPGVLILRMRGVIGLDATGAKVLGQSLSRLENAGWAIAGAEHPAKRDIPAQDMIEAFNLPWFDHLDEALEWAEDRLLARTQEQQTAGLGPAEALDPLLQGLPAPVRSALTGAFAPRSARRGHTLFRAGDPGDCLFIATRGAVRIELSDSRRALRVATFEPGVVFGEMALLDERPRSATARAEEDCELLVLSREALERAEREAPGAQAGLMRNLARILAGRLRDTNRYLLEADR